MLAVGVCSARDDDARPSSPVLLVTRVLVPCTAGNQAAVADGDGDAAEAPSRPSGKNLHKMKAQMVAGAASEVEKVTVTEAEPREEAAKEVGILGAEEMAEEVTALATSEDLSEVEVMEADVAEVAVEMEVMVMRGGAKA